MYLKGKGKKLDLKNISILYAEDEKGVRESVSSVMELYVDKVFGASDGQEALEYYNLYKPDILLLDICMPKKDGLEVLREIRKTDMHTPVIIMTAHTEKYYLLQAVELYITKYLIKPFNKKTLFDALNECLHVMVKDLGEKIELSEQSTYDFVNKTIILKDKVTKLNKKEISLLELLIKRAPNVITYEEIEYHVWDSFDVSKEAFKSLLKDLRKKVGSDIVCNRQEVGYFLQIK